MSGQEAPEPLPQSEPSPSPLPQSEPSPSPLPQSEPSPSPLPPADPEVNQSIIELTKLIVEIGDKLYFEYLVRNRLSTFSDTT